jgi:hypothetical protein
MATIVNDVALVFLPREITYVPRVELNRDANFPAVGQNLEVFGWGLTSFEPTIEFPNIIQTLTVQALTNEACGEQNSSRRAVCNDRRKRNWAR